MALTEQVNTHVSTKEATIRQQKDIVKPNCSVYDSHFLGRKLSLTAIRDSHTAFVENTVIIMIV